MRVVFPRALTGIVLLLLLQACVPNYNYPQGIYDFRREQYRDAFIRLRPEAMRGQADAQYAVGFMYYYGKGVTEDRRKAWMWITRAANAGQADAVRALAILKTCEGRGIRCAPPAYWEHIFYREALPPCL